MPTNSWSGIQNSGEGGGEVNIKIPEKCPDATCDGCNYHLIWETPFACHVCSEEELTLVILSGLKLEEQTETLRKF